MSFANSRFRTAVHALTVMAYLPDWQATSDMIAASVATDATVVRKLLSLLRQAGLVEAVQGRTGGYVLSRSPAAISLKDVFVALAPEEMFPLPDRLPNPDCPVGANIHAVLQAPLDAVRAGLEHALAQTSLADVVRAVQK